jgi:DNA repair protein RecN (Recombination protein N)
MLLAIQIRDFALFDDLELNFGSGLNVITGETGAGKSMLIDAVELVTGGRASGEQVRTGKDKTTIDAVFDLEGSPRASTAASAAGFDPCGGQLILSREVSSGGRSLCRINGRVATVAVVREIAGSLVEIHGQHEHQSLIHAARHREVLDNYAGPDLKGLAEEMASGHAALRALEQELASVAGDARDRAQRQDLIRFQLGEIEAAGLVPGEDEALKQERNVLVNSERLAAAAEAAYALLYGDAGQPRPAQGPSAQSRRQPVSALTPARDALSQALSELESAAALDQRLVPVVETIRPLVYAAEDVAVEIRRYGEGIEFDPGRLEQVQSRLALIALLRRKYADTVDGILAYAAGLRVELERLENSEASAEELEQQIAALRVRLAETASSLTSARRQAADRLVPEVTRELQELGMPSAEFLVSIESRPDPAGLEINGRPAAFDRHGVDAVEILLSPNPGEPPRRLARAASGGELSRVMLALKTVLARADDIPSLIFDEIDSGIGGATAGSVGLRLGSLGRTHQVFCVTHLPQIAAYADWHYAVRKDTDGTHTSTVVRQVSGPDRLDELARMLGAVSGSSVALRHAEELLARSQEKLSCAVNG